MARRTPRGLKGAQRIALGGSWLATGLAGQRMRCRKRNGTRRRDVIGRGSLSMPKRCSDMFICFACYVGSAWPACEAGLARFTPRHARTPPN